MRDHPQIHHLPTEERIRAIAYALWEEEGRPQGRAEDHWFRAASLVAVEAPPVAEPGWLRREDDVAIAASEEPKTPIEEIVKRMASGRAA